jgi:ubiquinone/menaquinone biosynthesis C-methylase UbiE
MARPSVEYIRERFNEFMPYGTKEFDTYDFKGSHIIIGRRERVDGSLEIIEYVLSNNKGEKLVVNNIWTDPEQNNIILPCQIRNSLNSDIIASFADQILNRDPLFKGNIAGFVFDPQLQKDISENSAAYIWERGFPASQFLPVSGYLRIAGRYIFAGSFLASDSHVLEAPCGFGYGAAFFAGKCRSVEALDISGDNIAFAQSAYRQGNIQWLQGDVTELPYPDGLVDIYVSFEVFEHLPVDRTEKHIKEASRVIVKDGLFIISTPNREMRKNVRNPFHIKEYSFGEFKEILGKSFSDIEFYSVSGYNVEKGMKDSAFDMIAVCRK